MLNVAERTHPNATRTTRCQAATPNIIAASPAMLEVLAMARRAAAGESKVLITGESGVGKDLIARHGPRRTRRGPTARSSP